MRALAGALGGAPLTEGYFTHPALRKWVDGLAAGGGIDHVYAFSSSMAPYVAGPAWRTARKVFDFVDIDSEKWMEYANAARGPRRALYRLEGRRMRAFEYRTATMADVVVVVSELEAELFRAAAPDLAGRVHAVTNGVDGNRFDPGSPAVVSPSPYPDGAPIAVFTGAMDYRANIDAAVWFAEQVFVPLNRRQQHLRLFIVGANPAPAVTRLGTIPGITVTGQVADIRPYIAHATVAVAPMRIARGIQNKVLEAMAMARPVIATKAALEGIGAADGREIIVANDAPAFEAAIMDLLKDDRGNMLGLAARRFALENFSWADSLREMTNFLDP